MKTIESISKGVHYTAINVGELDHLNDYSYLHPKLNQKIRGKVFINEAIQSSAAEISFSCLPPASEIPFLHKHREHEEIYIILKGNGQFQIDGEKFDVKEGSVIRIAPDGSRTLRNNGGDPMIYLCIQAQQDSLDCNFIADGYRTDGIVKW